MLVGTGVPDGPKKQTAAPRHRPPSMILAPTEKFKIPVCRGRALHVLKNKRERKPLPYEYGDSSHQTVGVGSRCGSVTLAF